MPKWIDTFLVVLVFLLGAGSVAVEIPKEPRSKFGEKEQEKKGDKQSPETKQPTSSSLMTTINWLPSYDDHQLVGGADWEEQSITFQVPNNWKPLRRLPHRPQLPALAFLFQWKDSEPRSVLGYLVGMKGWGPEGDGSSLGLSIMIGNFGKEFPANQAFEANWKAAQEKKEKGEYMLVEKRTVGDIEGILKLEAAPENADDVRRMIWSGYQQRATNWYNVAITLSSNAETFPRYEELFNKILDSFEIKRD